MKVYRLSRATYAHELSGKGAALGNNRWNSKGTEIVYTAQSKALALVEILVHLNPQLIPSDFRLLEIEIPDDLSKEQIETAHLPPNWNTSPPLAYTQKIGDQFISESNHAILSVPSAVVSGEKNLLLNPHHPRFNEILILQNLPFPIDPRLKR
jgi:RES domain-containing protein